MTPGWYADPHGGPDLRWWDGSSWTEHTSPPVGAAPSDTTLAPAAATAAPAADQWPAPVGAPDAPSQAWGRARHAGARRTSWRARGPGPGGPGSSGGFPPPQQAGQLEPHASRGARHRRGAPPRDRRSRPPVGGRRRGGHRPHHHDDGRHVRRHHDDHRRRHHHHDRARRDVRDHRQRCAQLHPPRAAVGGLGGERTRPRSTSSRTPRGSTWSCRRTPRRAASGSATC